MFAVNPLVEFNVTSRTQAASRELHALSDYQLRDIGLNRDQLDALAEIEVRRTVREAVRWALAKLHVPRPQAAGLGTAASH